MSDKRQKAGCLCGAVTLQVDGEVHKVDACHCGICRKWTGGPMMALFCGTDVEVTGQENITSYDSSPWGERAFCRHCGSGLYFRIKESGDYIVPAGLFEDQADFVFTQQIFIDNKPDFYRFGNDTATLTQAEFEKEYGGS